MSQKFKVNVYIDGFNLYHAIDDLSDNSLKWVNLKLLSENILNKYQILHTVKYFSAYATWRPDAYKRHRDFVAANEAQGVEVIMGRFKAREIQCKASCQQIFWTHEEKETDVNIGAHLIADTLQDKFDTALVISADTDLSAVMDLARELSQNKKRICAVAPPKRMSKARELNHLFEITKGKIRASLLPQEVQTPGGVVVRPIEYS